MRKRVGNRWVVLAVFGGLFAALFAIVGVATGIGHPSVPSGDVAAVEDVSDGTVTKSDFDAALQQTAAQQGLPKPPSPSSPQYASLRDSAMVAVIQPLWIRGEAEERGITVSNTEVQGQLQQIIKQQFGGQKAFQKYIKQAGYTPQQARGQVEVSMLSNRLQQEVLPQTATVPDSLINDYYQANKSQFSQPETRDVRQIVNKDQAKVQQAQAQLQKDDSAKSWKKVAAKYSTDKATNSNGGLRQGVTNDQSDPALSKQIFSAPQGTLTGPFKGKGGYYLIQVEKITPASTTPLSQVSSQIKQQLSQGIQQQSVSDLRTDLIAKWSQRTSCADGYVVELCGNFTQQDACNGDDSGESGNLDKTGCDAFVPSTAPVAPGTATVFPGQSVQGSPQGPIQAGGGASAQPGVIGPGGAPQLPPAAPPQTAPPQTAPPGG